MVNFLDNSSDNSSDNSEDLIIIPIVLNRES